MSEEIQVLDDEINSICTEVEDKLAAFRKKRKAKRKEKEEMCDDLHERMSRARDVYSTYRIELREVLKEKGKLEFTTWERKGHDNHKRIQMLVKEVQQLKTQIETDPLRPEDKDKQDPNTWQAQEVIQEAKRVQEKSYDSLARSTKLVASAEAMGAETAVSLKAQTEQMKSTQQNITEVNAGIQRADKVLKQIGRRIATDKMIACLVLVLLLAIVGLIVGKATGLTGGSGEDPVDCSQIFTQHLKVCEEQAKKAEAEATVKSGTRARHGEAGSRSSSRAGAVQAYGAKRALLMLGGIDMGVEDTVGVARKGVHAKMPRGREGRRKEGGERVALRSADKERVSVGSGAGSGILGQEVLAEARQARGWGFAETALAEDTVRRSHTRVMSARKAL